MKDEEKKFFFANSLEKGILQKKKFPPISLPNYNSRVTSFFICLE